MANYQNHVVDPQFFNDAIELFAFDYDIFVVTGEEKDEYGYIRHTFEKKTIRGSLQSQGMKLVQRKEGNTYEMKYEFYCRSLYRINIGDFILYKDKWLHVDDAHDFDEHGVRWVALTMVELTAYKDLEEYVKYLNGDITV